jgi:hypothetical protein
MGAIAKGALCQQLFVCLSGNGHVGRKFPVNSCLPDFPLINGAAFYRESRKTGIYEGNYGQTCTFPMGINI